MATRASAEQRRAAANRARAALLGAALLTMACSGSSGAGNASSRPAERSRNIRLEEVASIGCATCPQPEQVAVFAMGMDADGSIWAVDRYAPHMRVFRTNGELVAAFGDDGEGPGDFRRGPMESMITGDAVLTADGGEVMVHQLVPPALIGFDLEGKVTRNLPILVTDTFTQVALVMVGNPGGPRVFALSRRIGGAANGEPFIVHRFDIGEESVSRVEIGVASEIFPDANPEAAERGWFGMAVAPDGTLAIGDAYAYEIVRLDAGGRVLERFSHAAERPLKSEEMLDAERRAARRRGESVADVDIHDGHFRRQTLEFDDKGRLWVALNRPTRERTLFDVFAPDGTFLQQVDVPFHIQRYNIRGIGPAFTLTGGFLAAPVVGPDDNDRIMVWRVIDE